MSDRFGFLPINRPIRFSDGSVEPLPELAQLIQETWIRTHRDGHLYPGLIEDHAIHVTQPQGFAIKRPALLHKLPTSHTLTLTGKLVDPTPRAGDAAFLMHFVGFMLGHRLQFEGWWFDGRVPMTGRMSGRWWSLVSEQLEGPLLSTAYATWRGWPEAERKRFTNLLYMHVRSFSLEWDWERFAARYMIFDGCFRTALSLGHVRKAPHKRALRTMLAWAGLPPNASVMKREARKAIEKSIDDIVRLRHDLFHETLWDRGQPGAGSRLGAMQGDSLHRINDRLLWTLAGYRGDYLKAAWWDIGQALI